MPLGSLFNCRFRIVNDCDEPVAVPPKIKYHIPLNIVGVLERAAKPPENYAIEPLRR
jgi:hypothetical protein